MKSIVFIISLIVILHTDTSFAQIKTIQKGWTYLFNEKNLDGWDSYLGPKYDTVAKEFKGERMGLNNDPDTVFSVVKDDGQNVIRISGQYFGCIVTKDRS